MRNPSSFAVDTPTGPYETGNRRARRRDPRTLVALVALGLALALAACGAPPSAGPAADAGATATAWAAATGTADAQATQTARPVTISLQLAQRGSVAGGDLQLVATVTVANRTDAPIHLAGSPCQRDHAQAPANGVATLAVEVNDAPGHTIWQSWSRVNGCPTMAMVDVQTIAAGATYTTTLTCDVATGYLSPGMGLQAGTPYAVRGKVFLWHQKTITLTVDQTPPPGVLWGNDVATEVPFTFQ